MSSILITGASRGIGFEFLRQYSQAPENTVLAIVRDKSTTVKKLASDPDLAKRNNIHILEAELTNYEALKAASEEASNILGGKLDLLIGNAGLVTTFDSYEPIGKLGRDPEGVTKTLRDLFDINVIANVHLINLFVPLILAGKEKKVIILSSGMADRDFVNEWEIENGSLYAASKAAMNMVVAKYNAQYKKDGVLFLALCPGMVEVGHYKDSTPEQIAGISGMVGKFQQYAPHWTGPSTPEKSIEMMRRVIAEASLEKGQGGAFISHTGTDRWL